MTRTAPVKFANGRSQVHLTGFMASGKSTVGQLLARRLLWNFLDLDGVIERQESRSVARIFEEDGELAFREIERHVLRQVVQKPSTVVALGGGTLIDPANQQLCAERATVVWLRVPLEVLQQRCAGLQETRPLWGDGDALRQRYSERLPGYEMAAYAVDAAAAPEQVVEELLEALQVGS